MSADLDGARHTYVMIRAAGTRGLHSHEVLAAKFPGHTNPSQRFKEIADHLELRKRREHVNGAPGIRVWLPEFAPEGTEKVTPASRGAEGDDGPPMPGATEGATPAVVALDSRPCRRCDGGKLPSGLDCPACAGTGRIEAGRINSYVEEREAA